MADIIQITTHETDAKNRLLEQYKELPNIEGVVEAMAEQIQDLEDTAIQLIAGRALDSAVGVQLDRFGTIVVLARVPGQTDAEYRNLLKIKIGQNTSQGTPPKLIDIMILLTSATRVFYQNLTSASVLLAIDVDFNPTDDDDVANFIYTNMQKVAAGGVRIDYIICYSSSNDAFSFAGMNVNAPGLGFGNTLDSNAGGKLAKVHRLKIPFAFDGLSVTNRGFSTVRDPLVGGVLATT